MKYNIQQVTQDTISLENGINLVPFLSLDSLDSLPNPDPNNVNYPSYKKILSNVEIIKFGYCCENKGILYPIIINIDGKYQMIFPNKEGIYEMQPEEFQEETTDCIVTEILVPEGIEFTLDYVTPVN